MPLTLRLVLIALFAYAGYQRAGWFGRRYGRTPWGLPSAVWGVLTGLSLLLGCLLLAIAERQGRNAAAARPAGPAGHPGTPVGGAPGGPSPFGAPQFAAPQFGAPPYGSPAAQFGATPAAQFAAPPAPPAPQFGAAPAPQFGAAPAPQFGAAPAPQYGTPPPGDQPARRRPALNEWQDDPSGGFFGKAG